MYLLHSMTLTSDLFCAQSLCCVHHFVTPPRSFAFFNLYAKYIIQNSWLDESQAEIKIAGRNINNLRYADDNTLMAEKEEELKSLWMRVKEESEKAGLKLNTDKTKIMASSPIISWQTEGENVEVVTSFLFLSSKITADSDYSHEIRRQLLLGRRVWQT